MKSNQQSHFSRLLQYLFSDVDASSLAAFRIGFGALLIFNCVNTIALCLKCYFLEPVMLFNYEHFEWVRPWSSVILLNLQWLVMLCLAVCIMIGYRYRIAAILFTIGFSHNFLLDEAQYLNHYYMVILFCVLLCFIPANSMWSMDAKRDPAIAWQSVPRWPIVVLVLQLEIILIHAGLVKLNMDWLQLEPLRMWMHGLRPQHGAFFTYLTSDTGIAIGAYGAIALHLVGAPLLFFRRSRVPVLIAYGCFHLMNHFVFSIGIFPWMTLFASLLFLDPDWPRKLIKQFRAAHNLLPSEAVDSVNLPQAGRIPMPYSKQLGITTAIGVWLLVQILVPFRHWFYPGNVAWNEDGHRFAWRMKLRSKSGETLFEVTAEDGRSWYVRAEDYFDGKQLRKMTCIPDMLWQFAQFLESEWRLKGHAGVAVTVHANCSLNGRTRQLLIDPNIDLTRIARSPAGAYVLPLRATLQSRLR